MTSASEVWEKSSYHSPTAKKALGVDRHTSSSTSGRRASTAEGTAEQLHLARALVAAVEQQAIAAGGDEERGGPPLAERVPSRQVPP